MNGVTSGEGRSHKDTEHMDDKAHGNRSTTRHDSTTPNGVPPHLRWKSTTNAQSRMSQDGTKHFSSAS